MRRFEIVGLDDQAGSEKNIHIFTFIHKERKSRPKRKKGCYYCYFNNILLQKLLVATLIILGCVLMITYST